MPTGQDVEALRKAHGLSRDELAASAGLSPRTIFNIERGLVTPQRATRTVLAAALASEMNEGPPAGPLAKADDPAHEQPT